MELDEGQMRTVLDARKVLLARMAVLVHDRARIVVHLREADAISLTEGVIGDSQQVCFPPFADQHMLAKPTHLYVYPLVSTTCFMLIVLNATAYCHFCSYNPPMLGTRFWHVSLHQQSVLPMTDVVHLQHESALSSSSNQPALTFGVIRTIR